jgi:hypothetical protein
MTVLKLWYVRLTMVQKNEFRDNVMKNPAGIRVSVSSFFNYLELQHAPAPIQQHMCKISKDLTPDKPLELKTLYDPA